MLINEFVEKVAGGEISSIDIRKFFWGLSDIDKSDLLQDMFVESLAAGLSGHNDEEQRLADAINMLCDVFGWYYESDKKKYIHKLTQEPEQASDVQTTDAQSLSPEPQHEKGEQANDVVLPEVLNIERVKKIFDGAIAKGWMHPNGNNGYKWVGFGKRGQGQQLVYMCGQIFGYKKGQSGNVGPNIPSKELEGLFGITGFYSKLIKCHEAKPQTWRKPIDEMIEQATKST